MTEPSLAGALRAGAAGFYPFKAACELLIATCWPVRDDFTPFIAAGVSITDRVTPVAAVGWTGAIRALDAGLLPCSGAERRHRAGQCEPHPRDQRHPPCRRAPARVHGAGALTAAWGKGS